ncbi:expressed unknown protein [Seminavis robusta]|uniref:Uncharacterized protein n=1 Tax=Seminavis robusta TaxID=568900 RepID=A0A9N8ENX5_9STRA|nr:expressed unknown protein [Seminavis robusta]|eukprot:Sro1418_g270940.1 n/a (344) ;mRNA; f:5195-6309
MKRHIQQAGKILGTGDLNRAKKIYRKAQKLDPRRPEAFQNVSACFVHSGQCEEARYYMQEAVKRYAFAALIGYRGDRKLHESEITQVIGDWASDLFILSEGYDSKNEEGNRSPPPNWWLQDGMFKRITKVALNTAMACIKDPNLHCKDPQEHRRHILMWSAWRVRTLTRFLSQDHDATLPLSRTAEEFREVAELCLFLSANVNAKGEEKDGSVLDEEGINSLLAGGISATVCSAAAENTSEGSALQRGEAGLWVVIHGLCSPSETAMNNQFALVCLDGLEDGRVAVKVDGISETKRILACNLWEVPFSETKVALISTLEDAIQWQFVRGSRELALARVMAGRN